jgi:hypothetical protein
VKRFLKRPALGLVPIALAVLVFSVPTASGTGLQNVTLSCSDGANVALALDSPSLTELMGAVTAINLYPAGSPPLACGLSQAALASANPQYDYAVGGGYRFNPATGVRQAHFALSAHEGPHGAFGTYNSTSDNPSLDFNGDVTCLFVMGNRAIVGGVVRKGGDVGQEGTGFAVGFEDNGSPGNSPPDLTTLTDVFIPVPQSTADCMAEAFLFMIILRPVMPGNVTIRDAP